MDRLSRTSRSGFARSTASQVRRARWPLAAGAVALATAATALMPGTAARAQALPPHRQPPLVAALPAASAAQQRAALAYWTPGRMGTATSRDIRAGGQVGTGAAPASAPVTGKPQMIPGNLGEDAISADPAAFFGRPTTSAANEFLQVPTILTTQYPYRMNGRIFFDFEGKADSCSGTSVVSYHGSSDEDEVWTAGHCLVNSLGSADGIDATNIVFVPAYNGNAATIAARYPFGVFSYIGGYTTYAWLHNADLSEDEAAIEVGRNSSGQTLGQAVGAEGFAWNQSDNQEFVTFGYPADPPFTGTSMYEDIAFTDKTITAGSGQPAIGIVSPMTGGSSGGAWNIDWSLTNVGYIDGHNDFNESAYPGLIFSPYQDTLANMVRCFGASNC